MERDVFVIDDEPGVVKLVTVILHVEGFEVYGFTSPLDALAKLADDETEPQVMVLDINMPEMDGAEFYKRVREEGYGNPVLILSGFGARRQARDLGAEAFLAKPFDPPELTSTVRRLARRTATTTPAWPCWAWTARWRRMTRSRT